MTYVNDLEASLHDPNTVYAALNNHKRGDFKPYVLKSTNRGRSWTSITGDLPARGSVYTLAEDHVNPNLMFAGTEFGVFVTLDGGVKWIQLKGGIPTIAIRELEIQRRENDLVAASFGRGFYILDDYSPLRELSESMLQREAHIFPIKTAWSYIQARPLGGGEKASQGAGFYTAPNPPFGAAFTYYLSESLKTRREQRRAGERKTAKEGADVFYPSWDALKAEDREEQPAIVLTVRDEAGNVVRRLSGSKSAGIHRVSWDLRYPGYTASAIDEEGFGPMTVPGNYTLSIEKRVDGATTQLVPPTPFAVEPLGMPSLPPADRQQLLAFQRQTGELQRAVMGANRAAQDAADRIDGIKDMIEVWPEADLVLRDQARALELRLTDLRERLTGDPTRPRRSEPAMPGIVDRVREIIFGHWSSTSAPTATHRENYEIAAAEFSEIYDELQQLIERDLVALEERLEAAGAPWTAGRKLPRWQRP